MPLDQITAWDRSAATHICSRAQLGFTRQDVDRALEMEPQEAVRHLIDGAPDTDLFPPPPLVAGDSEINRIREEMFRVRKDKEARQKLSKQLRGLERGATQDLRAWWLQRMRYSPWPLRESMTLLWHGHFTSGIRKVKSSQMMWWQNETFREYGLGPFHELAKASCREPAMARYLDLSGSSKKKPNENLARELMELFLLGEGNYSEEDVMELARALTGFRLRPLTGELAFQGKRHDAGNKLLLGEEGTFDLDGAIDVVLKQDQCSRHVAGVIWRFFSGKPADTALKESLGNAFRDSGLHTGQFLQRMLLSKEFHSDAVRGSRFKSPVDWMVGTATTLNVPLNGTSREQATLRNLGQELLEPPNVKGWPGGRSWITASTLLLRNNVVHDLFLNPSDLDSEKLALLCPKALRSNPRAAVTYLIESIAPQGNLEPEPMQAFAKDQPSPLEDDAIRDLVHLALTQPTYQLA